MLHMPGEDQNRERVGAASPLDAALAQIGKAFGETARIKNFKNRVKRWLNLAPKHAAIRARFGARAALVAGRNLNAAVGTVERWWRDERKAFQIASALGFGTRLSLDVLSELRLILRLMRFRRMEAEFGVLASALSEPPIAMAAE